jgi:anti-sigma factor RsiW
MDCKFIEDVSLLMDGELSSDRARQIQSHLLTCAICQQAQADFLLLRQEIQDYQHKPDASAQRQVLRNIPDNERVPFWRGKIALPVPALALMLLLFVALSLWATYLRVSKLPQPTATSQPAKPSGNQSDSTNTFDLSRFDKGERAVIYTTRRTSTNIEPEKEIK